MRFHRHGTLLAFIYGGCARIALNFTETAMKPLVRNMPDEISGVRGWTSLAMVKCQAVWESLTRASPARLA